jgi:8-oxo-dGTP diphosphatase
MKHIACAIFVRNPQNPQVLLAKRAPHKAAYPSCWGLIGGLVEPGETPELAVVREAEEEIGLTPIRFALAGTMLQPKPDLHGEATFHCFTVIEWNGGEPEMLGDEHTDIGWFTIEEACSLETLALAAYRDLFRNLTLSA